MHDANCWEQRVATAGAATCSTGTSRRACTGWNELSGGSRLPADAPARIRAGVRVFGVSNRRFVAAARAVARGEVFPPLILAGGRRDALVCLEGHPRLTAYALAGFPAHVECLVGTAPSMDRWCR